MVKIAPSILAADFRKLGEEILLVEEAGVEYLHLDVMDGLFVPNLTFGVPIVKALRPFSKLIFDVHLMVEKPEEKVQAFAKAGTDIFSFHIEATQHAHRLLQSIHALGMKAGVSLNPSTSLSTIEEILPHIDMVLLMSVNPGFGGQKFIVETVDKISRLRKMIKDRQLQVEIEVDGGINKDTVKDVVKAGADVLVAGSAIFGAKDIKKQVAELRLFAENNTL